MICLLKVPAAVYRFHRTDGRLLYVGVADDIVSRWRWHQRNSGWWSAHARATVQWYATRALAERAESIAIRAEHPIHNVVGSGSSPNQPKRIRHLEVTADLRARIRGGAYRPGARLPSRTQICIQYGVSDIVAGAVMRTLKAEGLTEALSGVGTFVAERKPADQPEQPDS